MKRYCRNVDFSEIGEKGQKLLSKSHAVVVGVGALGGTIAIQLARAGIGKLTICDNDKVDIHNLQRQLLYYEKDVNESKLKCAQNALREMNSEIEIQDFEEYLTEENASKIIDKADIVMDGTDRMEPRYLINDYCIKNKIPYVYGGVLASYGMTFNIIAGKTPCLECIFPKTKELEKLPTCADVGIVNTVPTLIGSIQATEAIKILIGAEYSKELIVYDVWVHSFDKIPIKKRKKCPVCG